VLALVPDPRRPRGRRFPLAFVLAVAAACTLAGAKTFRETGDQAADLPQKVLRDLGGKPRPLRRKVIAPSETRIRTLLRLTDTEILDEITGGWLRDLADARRLDGLLTAIAIDGKCKWLRGVPDGQVKLFAAMLHEEKAVIAQHRIPDETTETTQVKEQAGTPQAPWRRGLVTSDNREGPARVRHPVRRGNHHRLPFPLRRPLTSALVSSGRAQSRVFCSSGVGDTVSSSGASGFGFVSERGEVDCAGAGGVTRSAGHAEGDRLAAPRAGRGAGIARVRLGEA
jgi:hypothetical protein